MNNEAANSLADLKAQCKPDPAKIFKEVKEVALNPVGCWNNVRGTYGTIKEYYLNFLAPLALIPAVVTFINVSIIGTSILVPTQNGGGGISLTPEIHRFGIVSGFISALVQFIVGLLMQYVFAFILGKVAVKFNGNDDVFSALKLAGYAASPVALLTVLEILPMGVLLVGLVGLYSLYIFYQGISPMLSVPAEKRVVYSAVSIGACFVAAIIIAGIRGVFHI